MANGDDQYQQPPQQPPPQGPPSAVQPTLMEQWGPLIGSALLGYFNMVGSPKYGGWNRAIGQGLAGGLNTYSGLEGLAQQHQQARQYSQALGQMTDEQRRWLNVGATPADVMKLGQGVTPQHAIETLTAWGNDPSLTPAQRAAKDAAIQMLSGRTTPLTTQEWQQIAKTVHMGEAPKVPMTAEGLAAYAAAHPDDPTAQKMARAADVEAQSKAAAGVQGRIQVKQAPGAPPQVAPEKTSEAETKIGLDAYNKAFNQYVKTHPTSVLGPTADEVASAAKRAGEKERTRAINEFRAGKQSQGDASDTESAAPTGGPPHDPLNLGIEPPPQ